MLDKEFGRNIYSLKSLFRDEQHRILNKILDDRWRSGSRPTRLLKRTCHSFKFLADLGVPQPRIFTLMSNSL